jgi:hypothetical protein
MKRWFASALFRAPMVLAVLSFAISRLVAAEAGSPARQVILLKLDDVTANGAHGKQPVSPRWQKLRPISRPTG